MFPRAVCDGIITSAYYKATIQVLLTLGGGQWLGGGGGVSHMSDSCLHFNKLNCCYTENISAHDTDYLKFEVFERVLSLPHSKQALATIHYLFRTKFKSTCCKVSDHTDYRFKLNVITYLAFDKIFKFLKAVNHIVINSIINWGSNTQKGKVLWTRKLSQLS